MYEKSGFVEELNEVIGEYCKCLDRNRLFAVLIRLFEGILENYTIPCPAEMDKDANLKTAFVTDEKGNESLVALTEIDKKIDSIIVDLKMRSLIRLMLEEENSIGLVLNPGGEHELFVPKMLFVCALATGYRMAMDEVSAES